MLRADWTYVPLFFPLLPIQEKTGNKKRKKEKRELSANA
jgi:hypothetical protein